MWPFKKPKIDILTTDPDKPDWARDGIRALQHWRPVGSTVEYLGRTLVVESHYETSFSDFGVRSYPCLQCRYADNRGVIRSISLGWPQARALMQAQP